MGAKNCGNQMNQYVVLNIDLHIKIGYGRVCLEKMLPTIWIR